MLILAIIKLTCLLKIKKLQRLLPRSAFSVMSRCCSDSRIGRNVEAYITYQKCVHIVFEHQIGRNVEAYIDDIVVNSRRCGDLLSDLRETFDNLQKYKMKPNPKKCIFGVSAGKLLGYMVSSRGIDANPKQIEAIDKLQPPQSRKDIQKLAGMMAALSRFISNSSERDMPFYKLLR